VETRPDLTGCVYKKGGESGNEFSNFLFFFPRKTRMVGKVEKAAPTALLKEAEARAWAAFTVVPFS